MRRYFLRGCRWILDYLYPLRCPVCDEISPQGICGLCRKQLKYIRDSFCLRCGKPLDDDREEFCRDCSRNQHGFEQGRALFSYEGRIKKSLYRLKYGNKREYAVCYGRELFREYSAWIHRRGITMIVPIPLYPRRRRERGYNQAALLAKELGRQTGIPVEEKLLFRRKETVALKTLSRQERRRNLQNVFGVRKAICPGERILLIDDIYTTGSTVDAAAFCLKRCGKCQVFVLTVAIGG